MKLLKFLSIVWLTLISVGFCLVLIYLVITEESVRFIVLAAVVTLLTIGSCAYLDMHKYD